VLRVVGGGGGGGGGEGGISTSLPSPPSTAGREKLTRKCFEALGWGNTVSVRLRAGLH